MLRTLLEGAETHNLKSIDLELVPGEVIGYDLWGRPIMGSSVYAGPGGYSYSGSNPSPRTRRDRDGDGVPNWQDRYPDDPRYR